MQTKINRTDISGTVLDNDLYLERRICALQKSISALATAANNGINIDSGVIQLGGALVEPTVITGDDTNTLSHSFTNGTQSSLYRIKGSEILANVSEGAAGSQLEIEKNFADLFSQTGLNRFDFYADSAANQIYMRGTDGANTLQFTIESTFANLSSYGLGNKEAADLGLTDSGYLMGLATDGTIIEVSATVTAASNGTSLNGTTVQLGQDATGAGAASLLSDRYIPMETFDIIMEDNTGVETFRFDESLRQLDIAGTGATSSGSAGILLGDDGNGLNGSFYGADYVQQARSGNSAGFFIFTHADAAVTGSKYNMYRSRGTALAQTSVLEDDVLGLIEFRGYDGTTYGNERASIRAFATEDYGANNHGGKLQFRTVDNGLASGSGSIPRVEIDHDGSLNFLEYGANTFAGPHTYLLGVDAIGNVVETQATVTAANNGTSLSGTTVQLGQDATGAGAASLLSHRFIPMETFDITFEDNANTEAFKFFEDQKKLRVGGTGAGEFDTHGIFVGDQGLGLDGATYADGFINMHRTNQNAGNFIFTHANSTLPTVYRGYKSRGTTAVPLEHLAGDTIVQFDAGGYNGASYNWIAGMSVVATEDGSAGNGADVILQTNANGSLGNPSEQFRFAGEGWMKLVSYGSGNLEAGDFAPAKTDSGYVAGLADDGTLIEVPKTSLPNMSNTNLSLDFHRQHSLNNRVWKISEDGTFDNGVILQLDGVLDEVNIGYYDVLDGDDNRFVFGAGGIDLFVSAGSGFEINNDPGTAGEVFTSNGATNPPTWESPGGAYGQLYFSTPAETSISIIDTPVKCAGTTTLDSVDSVDDDTGTDNRLRYTGTPTVRKTITAYVALTSAGTNKEFTFYIAKNGTVISASGIQRKQGTGADVGALALGWGVELATNDYVELWVENNTDTTNVTVQNCTLLIN